MLKISIEKSKITPAIIEAVHHFEKELNEFIKKALSKPEYKKIKCLAEYELKERKYAPVELDHNATVSLENSLSLYNLIKLWITKYEELEIYSQTFSILVKLTFIDASKDKYEDKDSLNSQELPIFTITSPKHSFEKIILPISTKQRIISTLKVVEQQDLVYNIWGFKEIDGIPRAIINFFGPPGTGKTMCAHAIAEYLKKPLLALNYSEIESKYIGDAPKNLKYAFNTAKEKDAVLFFDEADSFLGKRIQNVSQSADQALNSLRSQMLILLEEHEGIVIFATNLISNFDKAFESRILDNIEIPMPDRKGRARLINIMLPSKLPLQRKITGRELFEMSDLIEGLSGREIKNAILKMLLVNSDNPSHVFTLYDIKNAMISKMKEIESIRAEENRILVTKISKALIEKNEMAKAEKQLNIIK